MGQTLRLLTLALCCAAAPAPSARADEPAATEGVEPPATYAGAVQMLTQPREADEGLKILIEWYWHDPRTEALFARHAQPPTGKQKNDYRLKRSSQYFAKALRELKTKKLVETWADGADTPDELVWRAEQVLAYPIEEHEAATGPEKQAVDQAKREFVKLAIARAGEQAVPLAVQRIDLVAPAFMVEHDRAIAEHLEALGLEEAIRLGGAMSRLIDKAEPPAVTALLRRWFATAHPSAQQPKLIAALARGTAADDLLTQVAEDGHPSVAYEAVKAITSTRHRYSEDRYDLARALAERVLEVWQTGKYAKETRDKLMQMAVQIGHPDGLDHLLSQVATGKPQDVYRITGQLTMRYPTREALDRFKAALPEPTGSKKQQKDTRVWLDRAVRRVEAAVKRQEQEDAKVKELEAKRR